MIQKLDAIKMYEIAESGNTDRCAVVGWRNLVTDSLLLR